MEWFSQKTDERAFKFPIGESFWGAVIVVLLAYSFMR